MSTLKHQIRIAASAESVWDSLSNLLAVADYNPMISKATFVTDDHQGIGATRHCELLPDGFVDERVSDWRPNEAIGIEVVDSTWPVDSMRWTTELRAEGGETLVTQEMDYQIKTGPDGLLVDEQAMQDQLQGGIGMVMEGWKKFVESRNR